MFILLPPSEGKNGGGTSTTVSEAAPAFCDEASDVLKHLKRLKRTEQQKFYGVSTLEKTRTAHALNLNALANPVLPAVERYTGVVYTHIDYPSIPRRAAAAKRLLIVSALFGLIAGDTPIPDYKLPMNPWLVKYWKERNTGRLRQFAAEGPVLDLLSQSYRKALDHPNLLTVDFRVQGGRKAAGHFGKAIKGRFVRWILANNVKSPSQFVEFDEDGYEFDGTNFVQA